MIRSCLMKVRHRSSQCAPRDQGIRAVMRPQVGQRQFGVSSPSKNTGRLEIHCRSSGRQNLLFPPASATEDDMDTLTYWNGTWHEGNPAILGPRDHAFWLGSMVFDGGRAFEGCGPDLDLHAERVVRSAHALGLRPTKTAGEILALMHEGVRRFGPKAEHYVRPMFWATKGGQGPISVDPESTQFLLCVYHSPMRAGTPLTLGLCRTIRR